MNIERKSIIAALACALAVTGMCIPSACGQDIRITVTGSNTIPRIEGETALPVQVITREDIERANIQNAAELVNTLSANMSFNAFAETQAINGGSQQPGFAGASLRGLGYQHTLVLLNGRRIANYAFTTTGADLNSIPLAAIERVEVLKDGASAIYGSDAVAGVINFILRKDYQGAEASVQYTSPEHTGGYGKRFGAAAGYGDLLAQKFNGFVVIDYQQYGGVRAIDRPFASRSYIPAERVDVTSGNSIPANVDTPVGTRNPTGDPGNAYRNPACLPPLSFPTAGSPNQCRFDGIATGLVDIVDPSEKLNFVGGMTWQLNPDNQVFFQGTYARNKFVFQVAPTAISNATTFQSLSQFLLPPTSAFYPHAFARFFGIDGKPLNVRWRALELGPRADEPTSTQWNIVAGMRGVIKGWDYDGAFNYSESDLTNRYFGSYLRESVIMPILNSGVVNPFGSNTPDVVALLATAEVNGTVRTGKASTTSVDFHASKDIYRMPAGPLTVAAGAEARQEKLAQESVAALASGDILQVGSVPSFSASRNVWAVYSEANVPIFKTLEGNAAVRYDHYSDFGSTTNPKVSLRWQPVKSFVMRASVGTGFFAPSLPGLFQPDFLSGSSMPRDDPLRCSVTHSAQDCQVAFPVTQGGNPLLQPDKSFQWGVGAVWSPSAGLTLGVDFFDILIRNRIFFLGAETVFQRCPDTIHGSTCQFIHRGPVDPNFPGLPGPITAVDTFLTNQGRLRATGFDVNAQYLLPAMAWGQVKLTVNGTYNIKNLQQQDDGSYIDAVNHDTPAGVIPYWRHYLLIDWTYGPWTLTLTENYQRGTYDLNPGPNTGGQLRVIGDYDVWSISGSYAGIKRLVLSAGIRNVLDRNPPFSNQTATSQVGFDPSYTDPHGRLYWASVKYVFR